MIGNTYLLFFVTIAIFVFVVSGAPPKTPPSSKSGSSCHDKTEICWGKTSSHCIEKKATRNSFKDPKVEEFTFRAADDKAKVIVGIYATRFPSQDEIWGKGPLRGTTIARNKCYGDPRATYSVSLGTAAKPQTINMVFSSVNYEICKFGYNVKVCYE